MLDQTIHWGDILRDQSRKVRWGRYQEWENAEKLTASPTFSPVYRISTCATAIVFTVADGAKADENMENIVAPR
jgi:hypothetical protein